MIQVQIDDRIRLVASILLLTDFVNENSGFKPHPLKAQTIDYIKAAVIDETHSLGAMMTLKGYFPKSYETWPKQFNEIFIRAATALYCEQLEGEASARAMLDKEKRDFGIDVIDRMFWCLRDYLYARRRCEYNSLSEYLPLLSEKLAGSTARSP